MSEDSTWETDRRWRHVRVSSHLLTAFLRGHMDAARSLTAPPDLLVIGLNEVRTGPAGWFKFVVWSASFEPVPAGESYQSSRLLPLVDFGYAPGVFIDD